MDFRKLKKYKITILLVVMNSAIWLAMEILGNTFDPDYMYSHGAMSAYGTLVDHEIWRFFTSMFLHFGPQHLMNNMLLLVVVGNYLERAVGSVRYLIIYLVSGMAASVTSCLYMVYRANYGVSAGASGAVFGLVGGLVVIVIVHHNTYDGISIRGIALCAVLMVMAGLSSAAVDNAAHVGGLFAGVVLTAIIWKFTLKKKQTSLENGDLNEG